MPAYTITPRPLAGLGSIDLLLLDEINYLCTQQAKRSRSGAEYAMPSRQYLASKLGVCVTTISRRVARLVAAGYLDRVQRRPRRGVYSTNLYRLKRAAGAQARRLTASLQAALSRVTDMRHKQGFTNNKRNRSAASGAQLGPRSGPANQIERISAAELAERRKSGLPGLEALRRAVGLR